ncbi:hypothetical protein [Algoriphagus resistens]|uniref:hypothetical protein n=1 Tax=Algoriphagus resistens TaxID=1750590 RepID=UPI000716B73A|nr:hypothetical protein [Algoriphagus resistens]
MSKIILLNKGDIIRTNPQEGFWGISVVLSEKEKTPESHAMCHIAITPLLFQHKVEFKELNIKDLKPLVFERIFNLKGKEEFSKEEICIGVYTRRNKTNLEIIGSIEPSLVYDGSLPFEPWSDLEIKWPLCGDSTKNLGREAYINWEREKLENIK